MAALHWWVITSPDCAPLYQPLSPLSSTLFIETCFVKPGACRQEILISDWFHHSSIHCVTSTTQTVDTVRPRPLLAWNSLVYILYYIPCFKYPWLPQLGTVSPIDIYMKFLFLYRVKSWQNSVELRKYLKQISSGPGGQDQAQHIWQLARIPSTWTYKYVLHHIWLSTERNTTLHITYERFRCKKHPKFKFHNYFILLYFYVTFNDIVYTGSCHAQ